MKGRTNVSGGIVLNATTANCIVEDGNTIVAGDFVQTSYHPTMETNTIDNQTSQYYTYAPYICELDDGNMLEICVVEGSSSGRSVYKLYSKEDLTLLSSGEFSTSFRAQNSKIVNLGNNLIGILCFDYGNLNTGNIVLHLYNYDSTTKQITQGNSITVASSISYATLDCLVIDSTTVIVWCSSVLYMVDFDTQTVIGTKSISVSNNASVAQRRFQNGTMFVYDAQNKKFVISAYNKVGTYQFSNNTITELNTASYSGSFGSTFGFGRLSERTFYTFPLEERNSSGYYHDYAKVVVQSDDSISMVSLTNDTRYNDMRKMLFPFGNGEAMLFIVGVGHIRVAIISATSQDILPTPEDIYTYTGYTDSQEGAVGIQWLTSTTFRLLFVKSSTSSIFALNCIIAPNEISVSADVTYVKQYSTRCNGVAKQNGNAGDTISVYIPLANS